MINNIYNVDTLYLKFKLIFFHLITLYISVFFLFLHLTRIKVQINKKQLKPEENKYP